MPLSPLDVCSGFTGVTSDEPPPCCPLWPSEEPPSVEPESDEPPPLSLPLSFDEPLSLVPDEEPEVDAPDDEPELVPLFLSSMS